MYWQKYFHVYYSNDTVSRKEAKINVKGTDPLSERSISDTTHSKISNVSIFHEKDVDNFSNRRITIPKL